MKVPGRERADLALVRAGLCESREKAQRAILAGLVTCEGRRVEKPGQLVPRGAPLKLAAQEAFVGRGGLKLEAALRHFPVQVKGLVCLDLGSSTGGFTDCLLRHGAARVHAVDVGRGLLHWRLRQDPRVVVHEGLNARSLRFEHLGEQVDLATADLSFISLALILPAAFALLKPGSSMIALVKPQFELSPAEVGRGGVVRDAAARRRALDKIRQSAEALGAKWEGDMECPVPGRDGNVEWLAWMRA